MIRKIILISLLFLGIVNATTITTSKDTYATGEDIVTTFTDMTGEQSDWIAIYPAGSEAIWDNMIQWERKKAINGTHTFNALPVGNYEVRAFFNNSFNIEASKAFSVSDGNAKQVVLTMSKETYTTKEAPVLTFEGMTGVESDWIAIYPAGSEAIWDNMIQWERKKAINGTHTFNALPVGNYEARAFFNNSFNIEASKAFSVEDGNAKQVVLTMSEDNYAVNEAPVLTFEGMTGEQSDWIAIYPAGSKAIWDNMIQWERKKAISGTHTFNPLPAGNYEARAFFNNSFNIEASKAFSVGEENVGQVVLTMSKETYTTKESPVLTFKGMTGEQSDWIAIYPAGSRAVWDNMIQWERKKAISGTHTFNPLPAGNYEARAFFNSSLNIEASKAFTVEEENIKQVTLTMSKDNYALNEAPVLTFKGMTGTDSDWIAIYPAGSETTWDNMIQWERKKAINGTHTFNPLPRGDYEIRAFFNNSFHSEATKSFRVANGYRNVFLIQGQSNAYAASGETLPLNNNVKSFGSSTTDTDITRDDLNWHTAQANIHPLSPKGFIGKWGMHMGSNLTNSLKIPLVVLNGAVGATNISKHLRDNANPENLNTIYGRLLYRTRKAHIEDEARVLFWYQGENDGIDKTSIATYKSRFTTLYNSWKSDYKNLEKIYMFQVKSGCGNPVLIMEAQRQLANEYDDVILMSTTGTNTKTLDDNCHYTLDGYKELADRMGRLVKDDLYQIAQVEAHPPEVESIQFINNRKSVVLKLKEGQNIQLVGTPEKDFIVENSNIEVTSINILNQTEIRLNFSNILDDNAKLTYFGHEGNEDSWLQNSNKLGLITFYNMSINN